MIRATVDQLRKTIKKVSNRKGQSKRIPYMVVWNFTNMYNLSYKHCYQDAKKIVTPDEVTIARGKLYRPDITINQT